jgi:hypothetical protein
MREEEEDSRPRTGDQIWEKKKGIEGTILEIRYERRKRW